MENLFDTMHKNVLPVRDPNLIHTQLGRALKAAHQLGTVTPFRATPLRPAKLALLYNIYALLLSFEFHGESALDMCVSLKGVDEDGGPRNRLCSYFDELWLDRWRPKEWLGLDFAIVNRRSAALEFAFEAEMSPISSAHFPSIPSEDNIGPVVWEHLMDFYKLIHCPAHKRTYLGRISSRGENTQNNLRNVQGALSYLVEREVENGRVRTQDSIDIVLLLTGGAPRYVHASLSVDGVLGPWGEHAAPWPE